MAIPYRYDPLGANGANANSALLNVRGCFVYQSGTNIIARSGMVLSDTVLVYNRHNSMIVSSGGIAKNATVNSACQLYISSGGSASGVTANYSAYVCVLSGGVLENYKCGGQRCYTQVLEGGVVKNATVKSGSGIYLNGYGSGIKLSQYGYVNGSGNIENLSICNGCYAYASAVTNATVDSGGSVFVTNANSLVLNQNASANISSCGSNITAYGARINVMGSASINGVVCNSGTVLNVSSGAQIINAVFESGTKIACRLDPYDNTVISGTYNGSNFVVTSGIGNGLIVDSGTISVCFSGSALNTKVGSSGYMYMYDGAYASNTHAENYGRLACMGSCLAVNNTMNYLGTAFVSNGGSAFNNVVNSGGYMYVSNFGVLSDTTVSSGGNMYVGFGGSALGNTVKSGGNVTAYFGELSNTVLDGGYIYCSQNCIVDNITCGVSGNLFMYGDGNKLTDAVVSSGAFISAYYLRAKNITSYQGAYLLTQSCVISNIHLEGSAAMGYDRIYTLNVSSGALARLYNSAIASGVHVYSAGSMHVSSGCMAIAVTSDAGAIVTSDTGAVIEYVTE